MRRPLLFLLVAVTIVAAQTAARASAAMRRFSNPANRAGASRSMTLARQVVAFARRQVGVAYTWGGNSRRTGFDCSGLVYAAYRSIGRTIPRSSWDQRRVGRPIGFAQMRPGDLLFTEGGGHVVLVTSKSAAVSAPGEGSRLRYVPLAPLRAQFAGARRLLN